MLIKRLLSKSSVTFAKQYRFKHTDFVPLFERVKKFPNKIAIHDKNGSHTYGDIFVNAKKLSDEISQQLHGKIQERVLFLCSNDVNYVVTLWAIWMSGQTAVPLSPLHPENILNYYVSDTSSKLLISAPEHREIMNKIAKNSNTNLHIINELVTTKTEKINLEDESYNTLPTEIYEYSNALILYTSGTTGKPKGVVLPHKTIHCQIETLLDAWRWSESDTILHTLPLHHVHGTVNALFCPLNIGATTVMLPKFSAETVWSYILGDHKDKKISVFMAVPTIYAKLVEEYERKYSKQKEEIKNYLKSNVRLMVSGSAPLPKPLHEKWYEITGHKLLERYGMTETGMILSNEYLSERKPGFVGIPLPGVSIRLVEKDEISNKFNTILECKNQNGLIEYNKTFTEDVKGELLVKGSSLFKEYYNKPEITKEEFYGEWFKTGDMCEYTVKDKLFRMLGRKSVDIIKSGGYKISALQIETTLLAHPDIKEIAVVGLNDPTWGEKIAAVIVPEVGCDITLDNLRNWSSDKMPKYQLPTVLKIVENIPKNAMGKVNKKDLVKTIFKE